MTEDEVDAFMRKLSEKPQPRGGLVTGRKKLVAIGDVMDLIEAEAKALREPTIGRFISLRVLEEFGN